MYLKKKWKWGIMMTRMSTQEKIDRITNDRLVLLNSVKDNLKYNNSKVIENIDEIINYLYKDEAATKEYKAIIKAKQLIEDLTNEILESNSIEEIIAIRKKINYYINKIKNELKERNDNQVVSYKFSNRVNDLRSDISNYIRYTKREYNINEIIRLNSIEKISLEDKEKLKRLLRNELNYMRKHVKKIKNDEVINNASRVLDERLETIFKSKAKSEKLVTKSLFLKSPFNLCFNTEDYYKERYEVYNSKYGLNKVYEYDKSTFKNIIYLFINVPKYIENKKKIKLMEMDFERYYGGEDLRYYIEYTRKNNSFTNAIKTILQNTRLSSREKECLKEHDKYMDWILNYCNSPRLKLSI